MIAIYEGTCDKLSCVMQNDGLDARASEVTWKTKRGVRYFMLVAGVRSASGQYTLSVATLSDACSEQCEEATAVSIFPAMFSGSTLTAEAVDPSNWVTTCFADLVTEESAGIWLELEGSGSCISVSAIDLEIDIALALFVGGCESLQCIDGRAEVLSDLPTRLSFFGEVGVVYHVFASSYLQRGNFQLNVTNSDDVSSCQESDFTCALDDSNGRYSCFFTDAERDNFPFPTLPSSMALSCATYPFVEPTPFNCICLIFLGRAETDIDLSNLCRDCTLLAQDDTTNGQWDIAYDCSNVAEGPCVGLTVDGDCIVNNPNNLTEPVSIVAQGGGCTSASMIDALPFAESNSSLSLDFLGVDADAFMCSSISSSRFSKWFTFTGAGSCVRASTGGSEFDTLLAAYAGVCGGLTCVIENDDDKNAFFTLTSSIEWFAEEGVTYYIMMQSYDLTDFGNYVLQIEEIECNSNEECFRAELAQSLPFEVSYTISATDAPIVSNSPALACSLVQPGTLGTWYAGQIQLSDSCVRVFTEGSQLDTILAVYQGTCGSLTCVAENDNASNLVRSSEITLTAEFGRLYYVFVAGARNATGEASLLIDFISASTPCP